MPATHRRWICQSAFVVPKINCNYVTYNRSSVSCSLIELPLFECCSNAACGMRREACSMQRGTLIKSSTWLRARHIASCDTLWVATAIQRWSGTSSRWPRRQNATYFQLPLTLQLRVARRGVVWCVVGVSALDLPPALAMIDCNKTRFWSLSFKRRLTFDIVRIHYWHERPFACSRSMRLIASIRRITI